MGFLYSQLVKKLPYPTGSYSGKTIIITGSNVGLGKEAARHYVRLGASRLILAVRSLDKGHEAKHDIEASTGCPDGTIEVWKVDMASYASVQKFAARVRDELDRVDIFHANAGIARGAYSTVEGNEEMITVNVISTLLLAALVLPKLKDTASRFGVRPTLSITTSGTHGHTTLPQKSAPEGGIIAAVNDKDTAQKHWDDQYPISKLLGVFAVRSIAARHPAEQYPVTINLVDPGLCHSELGRDYPGWGFWLIKTVLARSTEVGSRTLLHAGAAGRDSHGQYCDDCEISVPAPFVTSDDGKTAQERVWKELMQILEKVQPGVTNEF
ncbi:DmxR8 [Diaporthe amygdali]|uniref:DmxR8 n=1 Tax=Phomopsis amygdali TaxID=1214568 RepID=UPI0022FE192B|nr:DmxR8 [Diaporthe amygdali]KAJ0120545.1 DmxR8 [Diaporthe amygdali]